jgi:hypothetical protein
VAFLQAAKSGPLARLWEKVERDQVARVNLPGIAIFDYFLEKVNAGHRYAFTTDKIALTSKMAVKCPSCVLLEDVYAPLGLAMVVFKGAPFRKKMSSMYV